jgi:hypothetical protein
MSWNCAGWGKRAQAGKRKAFVRLLRRERPAVVGLQETHVGLTDRQVEVPGYYTLSAPVQDDLAGCWGMCMLVARGLHVRALDTGDANVQAVLAGEGVVVDALCVLVNVYIPTRGAGGKETRRTQVVKRLGSLVQQWYARYGDALAVVVMGDFNCPDRGDLDELLTRGEVMLHPGPLHMSIVANQHPTRVLKCMDGVKETTLDHFMVNTPARKLFNKHATSLLSCREDLQSDHAPIVVGFRSPKAKQRQRKREGGPPSASGEDAEASSIEGRQEAAGAGARAGAGAGAGDDAESTHHVGATPSVDLDLVASREQQIVHDPEWLHAAVVIRQDREGGQLRQGLEGAEAPPSIANPPEVFYRTAMRVLRRHGCIKDPRDRRGRSRLQDKDELGQRKRKRKRMSLAVANAVQKRIRIRKRIEKKSSTRKGVPSPEEDAQAMREATTKAKELKAKARQRGWTEATRKATEAAKRGDWEQVWKYIKKTVKKQVGSPLGVPLRDPATGQLVYDEDSKTGVLMAHFAHLAVDPHPQSREWWEQQHPLPEEGECKELDVEVSWPEVSTALARATTSKAPGLDGLPNEVLKMCKGPPTAMEPPNPMAAALLEQCRAMLDGQVSQELNTSVLVALDKPGKDAQEVGNKRGISLMPTLLKLATKIAANRIQNHIPEVAKEQAGFRPGEECLQNVAALHEVCHLRRHHWGQPTYVAFMDLKKAFDTVPHAAMLHVLHAKGVRGKIYRFIDKVYQSGSFVLQHHQHGTTTAPAPIQRGVRQGDTLSPLLFSLFIDHALDGLEGVEVPDRQGRTVGHMRGLLVADDAVLLAPHAEGIQAALAKFQTWCDTYHMQVGHDKCGLMVPLPEFQHLQAQAKEAPDQFMCQGQPIPVVDQYTYLGLQIDLNLSTDTLRKGRLEAGEQALRALAPMLANARVPLALKAVCIKGLLLPTLTYGAEIWGAGPCQDHTDIHTIYSDAMQLAIVGTRKAKATYRRDSATIELGLPSIQAAITTAPTRAIRKWTQSKTWIQDLLLHHDHRHILEAAVTALHTPPPPLPSPAPPPPPHATDTSTEAKYQQWIWELTQPAITTTCTTTWIHKATKGTLQQLANTHRTIAHHHHQPFYDLQHPTTTTISTTKELTKHIKKTEKIRRVIVTSQRTKSTAAVPYQYCLATATELVKQGLKSGTRDGIFITPLIRARLNGYGNLLYRQRHFAPAVKTNLRINGIESDHYCCSCKTPTKDTLHHLGMECTAYAELRNTYLNSMLDHFRALLNVEGIMDTDEDLWMLCLGGTGLIADKYCNNDLFTELTKYWLYADPETPSPPSPENEIEPPSPAPPPFQQTAAFIKSVVTRHTRAIDTFLCRHERTTTKKTPPPRQPSSSRSEREGPSHAAGHGSQKPETTLKQSKITSLWRRALAP